MEVGEERRARDSVIGEARMFIIICLHDQLTRWMIRNGSIHGERYCFSSERFLKRHGRLLSWLVRRVYLGGVLNKTGLSAARTTGNKNFVMGVTFQSRGFALLVTE